MLLTWLSHVSHSTDALLCGNDRDVILHVVYVLVEQVIHLLVIVVTENADVTFVLVVSTIVHANHRVILFGMDFNE